MMTSFRTLLTITVIMSLLIIGCSNDPNDTKQIEHMKELQSDIENKQNYKDVIASEKTLPIHFHEIAFKREIIPLFQYLVRKAVNQSEFEHTWNLYGFENKMPDVMFNEKDVFFVGVQESGSCPSNIKNIELNSDNKTMTVPLSGTGGVCTTNATPRTFVIQIDKEISQNIENVVIIDSGVETNVPFES